VTEGIDVEVSMLSNEMALAIVYNKSFYPSICYPGTYSITPEGKISTINILYCSIKHTKFL
jgi:hypothetical protein